MRCALMTLLALAMASAASAQTIEVLDTDFNTLSVVWTEVPTDVDNNGTRISDVKTTADGTIWATIHGSISSSCNNFSDVVTVSPSGTVTRLHLQTMHPAGLAVGDSDEVFVARTRLCERNPDGTFSWDRDLGFDDMVVERFAPGGTAPTSSNDFNRYTGAAHSWTPMVTMPDGSILLSNRYRIDDMAGGAASVVYTDSHSPFYTDAMAHNSVTNEMLRLNYTTGNSVTGLRLSRWSPGTSYPGHAWSLDAALLGTSDLASLGLVDFQRMAVLANGNILLMGEASYSAPDQGPYERFGAKYAVLDSQGASVVDSGWLALASENLGDVAVNAAGNIVIGSHGRARIYDRQVTTTSTTPGALTTFEVTLTLPVELSPTDSLGIQLDTDVDHSSAYIELVSGVDGTATFSEGPYYFGSDSNAGDRGLYAWRNSGSVIAAGTQVVFRVHDVVLPSTPGVVTVTHVAHRPNPTDYYDSDIGKSLGDVLSIDLSSGISCPAGLDPVDLDLDSEEDSCIASGAVIDPTASLAAGVFIHPGATVSPGAVVGPGTVIQANAVVGAHAIVGADCTIGESTVVLQRAQIGDRTTIGPDSTVARAARIGSDTSLPAFSAVGYGALVGDHVTIDNGLQLGSLASLGGLGANADAIRCPGPVTIARSSSVAASSPYTLSCVGSAVVGPNVSIGANAVFGDGFRIRKSGVIGAGFTAGEDVRVGRDVTIGDDVSLAEGDAVSALVRLCDGYEGIGQRLERGFEDPGCN